MPLLLYILLSNQGSFPPQAFLHILSTMSLFASQPTQAAPRGFPVAACHTTDRASRVATPLIFHACQCHYTGGNTSVRASLSSQCVSGFPLITTGSASASIFFEACSTFTRVPARMFAESPEATLLTRVLQTMSLPP